MEHNYTDKDLQIAGELGALTKTIMHLDEKITMLVHEKQKEHEAMWNKLDKHDDKIDGHNGLLKWIIGIGVGAQVAWGAILSFFKHM